MITMNKRRFLLGQAFLLLTLATPGWPQAYEYDAAGRLIRVAYPGGGGVGYVYDDSDNMTAVLALSLAPAPAGLEVSRMSADSARVTWQGDPAATGYVIQRRREGSTVWEEVAQIGGGTTTFIDPNIEPGVDYSYRVAAITADGRGAFSEEATFLGPQRPLISEDGIVNGASFEAGRPVTAGSIISIFGGNLGQRVTPSGIEDIVELADSTPLPTKLGGYEVLVDGVPAPLYFVGRGQINAQVPWRTKPGTAAVVVRQEVEGEVLESLPTPVPVSAVSPALFTFDGGTGRVVAVNLKLSEADGVINGSIAHPEGSFPGTASQPAPLGGVVLIYANGLGAVEPAIGDGVESSDALRSATTPLSVFIGGARAKILFAGLSPQFVGVYQLNVEIPQGAVPEEETPIRLEQGGISSPDGIVIGLRP
jgi:uncharacterized protein (TIGR03437 family)